MQCRGDCRQGRDCYCGAVPPETEDRAALDLFVVAAVIVMVVVLVTLAAGRMSAA
jgi:hypothetical protein